MIALLAGFVLAAAGVTLLRVRRRFLVVTVRGPSMEPALRGGDRLLARRVAAAPVVGQIVVIERPPPWHVCECRRDGRAQADVGRWLDGGPMPTGRWLIKRVVATDGDPLPAEVTKRFPCLGPVVPPGHIVILGDNQDHSFDSRQLGCIPLSAVHAVATSWHRVSGKAGTRR